jgi:hypothetical protein
MAAVTSIAVATLLIGTTAATPTGVLAQLPAETTSPAVPDSGDVTGTLKATQVLVRNVAETQDDPDPLGDLVDTVVETVVPEIPVETDEPPTEEASEPTVTRDSEPTVTRHSEPTVTRDSEPTATRHSEPTTTRVPRPTKENSCD